MLFIIFVISSFMFLGFNCAAIASEDDLFSIVNSATDPSVFSDYSSSITDPGDLDVTSDVVAIPGGNLEQNIFSDDLNDASSYADFTDPSSSLFASENNGDDNSTPLLLADSNNQGCASETSQLLNGLRARNEACANNDRGSSDMSLSSQLSSFINLDTMKLKAICPSQLYIPFSIAVCSSGKKNNIGWLPIDVPISQILSYDLIDAQIITPAVLLACVYPRMIFCCETFNLQPLHLDWEPGDQLLPGKGDADNCQPLNPLQLFALLFGP